MPFNGLLWPFMGFNGRFMATYWFGLVWSFLAVIDPNSFGLLVLVFTWILAQKRLERTTRPNEFGSMTARKDNARLIKSIFCPKWPQKGYTHKKAIKCHTRSCKTKKAIQDHKRSLKAMLGPVRPFWSYDFHSKHFRSFCNFFCWIWNKFCLRTFFVPVVTFFELDSTPTTRKRKLFKDLWAELAVKKNFCKANKNCYKRNKNVCEQNFFQNQTKKVSKGTENIREWKLLQIEWTIWTFLLLITALCNLAWPCATYCGPALPFHCYFI